MANMYAKILVPFDHAPESEDFLPMVQELLYPGGMGSFCISCHEVKPRRPIASRMPVNR